MGESTVRSMSLCFYPRWLAVGGHGTLHRQTSRRRDWWWRHWDCSVSAGNNQL